MQYLRLFSLDPTYNLAVEEQLFATLPPEHPGIFMLWQNAPSVIVGRYQCTAEEVNAVVVAREHIPVVRRITGGGAVYHDLGNLNFSFLANSHGTARVNFQQYLKPIVVALAELGVQAAISGRNDLEVDGKKISGSGQLVCGSRILHHGTLLINVDRARLDEVLTVAPEKIHSRGIQSVRMRVGGIADYWHPGSTLDMLIEALRRHCTDDDAAGLTPVELAGAEQLAAGKYRQWHWNYGASPPYTREQKRRFPWGTVCLRLDVQQGVIRSCRIFGDFFSMRDIAELEALFAGCRHERQSLRQRLQTVSWEEYFVGSEAASMLHFFGC